jgi:hypothetical protein
MDTFSFKNYSIITITSLIDRSIYLKVTDTINNLTYEGSFDLKKLRIYNLTIDAVYISMANCFNGKIGCWVDVSQDIKSLKLHFGVTANALIEFETILQRC